MQRGSDEQQKTQNQRIFSFNDQGFLGPKCIRLALSQGQGGVGYFTDTGSLQEAFMQSPKGSVYMFDLVTLQVKALCKSVLSYPSALALTPDEETVYVCETGKNRLLRFVRTEMGAFLYE